MKKFSIRCFLGFHKLKPAGTIGLLAADGKKIAFEVCQRCGEIILPPLEFSIKLNWGDK